jgi:hypothetical protein
MVGWTPEPVWTTELFRLPEKKLETEESYKIRSFMDEKGAYGEMRNV